MDELDKCIQYGAEQQRFRVILANRDTGKLEKVYSVTANGE